MHGSGASGASGSGSGSAGSAAGSRNGVIRGGATVVGSIVVVDSKSGAAGSDTAEALQVVVSGNAGSRSSGASRGSFTGRANSGARGNGVVRGVESRSSPTSFNYVRAVVKSPSFGDEKE